MMKNLIIYEIAKALGASEVDYIHMANLQEDYLAAQDSSPQDLRDWEIYNLQELITLQCEANGCETGSEAEQALQDLAVSVQIKGDWRDLGSEQFDTFYRIYLQGAIIQGELDVTEKPCTARLYIEGENQPLEYDDIQPLLKFAIAIFNRE